MRRDQKYHTQQSQNKQQTPSEPELPPPEQDNWREKGANMLAKMGWKPGEGLGKDGGGIKEALTTKAISGRQGLGNLCESVDRASVYGKVGEICV
jgi:hypothetical protein